MNWEMLTGLIGGVGLFVLGMTLMTDGLKIAAGKALRHILEHSMNTRTRALGSGFLITSMVQSSSAVTVAIIGFVNAGLIKLSQSIWVIYGSNVGTTMTGWLVALLGFHINIQLMALPAIGVGMLIKLIAKSDRHAAYGLALTGFGVLFLGIDILKGTFANVEHVFDLQILAGDGFIHLLVFLGVGFLMTLLMQSSSASMALTLTAAGSGLIPLEAAAAMVIGSNLGTTSTAVIAAIGATSNAKRVAASHVIFNLVTGAVALLILPLLLWLVSQVSHASDSSTYIATVLALFHTVFNILGVLLMWFFTSRMIKYLKTCFVAAEEDEANPRYLDATLVNTPELAHQALNLELRRVAGMVSNMAKDAISTEASQSQRLQRDLYVVTKLVDAIGDFINRLQQAEVPEYLSPSFIKALASARYFIEVADSAHQVDLAQSGQSPKLTEELHAAINEFRKQAVAAVEMEKFDAEHFDLEDIKKVIIELKAAYESLKSQLLRQGTLGYVPVRQVVATIELLKNTERLAKEMLKGMISLYEFATLPERPTEEDIDSEEPDEQEKESLKQ